MILNNPGAVIENTIRQRMIRDFFRKNGRSTALLDLGCGPRPYYSVYSKYCDSSTGTDLKDSPFPKHKIDIYCSATSVPLPDSCFDVILCTEVLHDIPEPFQLISEAKRLLKPGGKLLLTTPFVVPLVDGEYDHYRYTANGLKFQVEKGGLKIQKIEPVSDIFGAALTLAIKPTLKIFSSIAKILKFPGFYSAYNPLLFLFIILPQLMYLFFFSIPPFKQIGKKFSYGSIGFITIAVKEN